MVNKRKQEKKERNKKDKEWALAVKARDGNKCVVCGAIKFLNAHHIINRTKKELRLDIKNGIVLCPKHHRFSFEFSAHQNPFVFVLWLMKHNPKQFEYLKEKTNAYWNI